MCQPNRQIDKWITELRHAVIIASLNYDIWWVYRKKETTEQFIDVMNDYPNFFCASIHAHFVAILAALYYVYETRSDTVNMSKLFNLLLKEGILSNVAIGELRDLYNIAKPLWVKISTLRNKKFMHLANQSDDEEDAFRKANMKPNDFKCLIEITRKLLNKITHERSRNTHAFNRSAREDTIRLLNDLNTLRAKD